ncbi:polysaccharide pyruvyl transferase family protein [Accumulibacter sp.]|uniref:polysaccharide pyruvyl transferase family protein n=1 Tax=Accumulibacter sp. TaxID=2053492 RepID=UPI0026094C63|nr:polysaccharide pyruvyl transferase family protein [Accumulibacter sp.]
MRPIRLYWWQGEGEHDAGRRNFGDYLSPLIVGMVSRRPVEYSPVEKADLLAIGTILKRQRKARRFLLPRRLHIWGSGAGDSDERFPSRHYYHAVRGRHTLACIDGDGGREVALGDPGLLVAEYWSGRRRPDRRHSLGVIPHFVDQGSAAVETLLQIRGARLINVFAPIDEVLSDVLSCAFVVSSSLHGLIVSDALGVPNRRLVISRNIRSDLKFADYYSAFGLAEPPALEGASIRGNEGPEDLVGDYRKRDVDGLCAGLLRAFPPF